MKLLATIGFVLLALANLACGNVFIAAAFVILAIAQPLA